MSNDETEIEEESFERIREPDIDLPSPEDRLREMLKGARSISGDRWDRESQRRKEMPFMKRRHVIASVEDEEAYGAAGSEQEKPDDGEEPFRRVPSFGDED